VTNSKQTALLDGQLASVSGKPLKRCPYPMRSRYGQLWMKGWMAFTSATEIAA
jgi:ribosome modulation factor